MDNDLLKIFFNNEILCHDIILISSFNLTNILYIHLCRKIFVKKSKPLIHTK